MSNIVDTINEMITNEYRQKNIYFNLKSLYMQVPVKVILLYVFLKTEKEALEFANDKYFEFKKDYCDLVRKQNEISHFCDRIEIHVSSEEEVEKKYGGNYYNAML